MTSKEYSQILPLDKNKTVIEQFGWLPSSVFTPEKKTHLEALVSDEGDPTGKTRRSSGAKYLPKLRYSRFHPHLAEIVIRYWSLPKDTILDPFSGRSCRAKMSVHLGRNYVGYEISPATADSIISNVPEATIHVADGCLLEKTEDSSVDLVFTCPPYHRLEKYEDVPHQLSSIPSYEGFLEKIRTASYNIYRVLKPGKFVCWVCADWRDGKAFRLFHVDTIKAFQSRGMVVHDIVIIKNKSPFVRLQAGKVASKRYTSKTHEYLLVFRKEH